MLSGSEGWNQPMNKGRMRVDAGWRLMPRLIGRCCGKGIEQIQKGGGRELEEHPLDCGYTSKRVLV